MDRGCGRTQPDPCSGLCDADIIREPQLQHSVQHVGRDGHLGRLSPVRLEAQSIADDALPARDIGLHQGAPVVPFLTGTGLIGGRDPAVEGATLSQLNYPRPAAGNPLFPLGRQP